MAFPENVYIQTTKIGPEVVFMYFCIIIYIYKNNNEAKSRLSSLECRQENMGEIQRQDTCEGQGKKGWECDTILSHIKILKYIYIYSIIKENYIIRMENKKYII